MSYSVTWLVDKRVIYLRLENEINLEEADFINHQLVDFFNAGEPPLVHLIVDTTRLTHFPTNLALLNKVSSTYMKHPLLGWIVVVGNNPMARFIGSMITQIFRVRFRMVTTFEAAIVYLSAVDTSGKNLLNNLNKAAMPAHNDWKHP